MTNITESDEIKVINKEETDNITEDIAENNDNSVNKESHPETKMDTEKVNGSANADSEADLKLLHSKIVRQIEFYFGDVNLCRDKFMLGHIQENDGWFNWDTMLKFKRLSDLTTDSEVICSALATSSSGLIEISEDKSKIRRCTDRPIPKNMSEVFDAAQFKSVYAKPFPLNSTLDELQKNLGKYGYIEYIQMRKDNKKKFKGSLFIQFSNKEDAEAFVNNDIDYENQKLVKYMKKDYLENKENEKKSQKEEIIQKREKDNQDRKDAIDEKLSVRMTKGAILEVKGLPEDSTLDDLKLYFAKYGKCVWVDYNSGIAKVRFEGADSAKTALEKAKEDEGFKYGDVTLEGSVLDGEEETKHWQVIFEAFDKKNTKGKFGKRRHDRRGGGGPSNKKFRR